MKIIVCLKQVPKNDSVLRINEDGTWIQDRDLTWEINESDQYALEAALQLKERHGGEVIALSLGPARVQTVIKEALARGAASAGSAVADAGAGRSDEDEDEEEAEGEEKTFLAAAASVAPALASSA